MVLNGVIFIYFFFGNCSRIIWLPYNQIYPNSEFLYKLHTTWMRSAASQMALHSKEVIYVSFIYIYMAVVILPKSSSSYPRFDFIRW